MATTSPRQTKKLTACLKEAIVLAAILLVVHLATARITLSTSSSSATHDQLRDLNALPLWRDIPTFSPLEDEKRILHPICASLPHASPTFLWNLYKKHQQQQQQQGFQMNGLANKKKQSPLDDNPHSTLSTTDLRRSIRTRPSLYYWQRLMDKIHTRISEQSLEPLNILLVLSHDTASTSTSSTSSSGLPSADSLERARKWTLSLESRFRSLANAYSGSMGGHTVQATTEATLKMDWYITTFSGNNIDNNNNNNNNNIAEMTLHPLHHSNNNNDKQKNKGVHWTDMDVILDINPPSTTQYSTADVETPDLANRLRTEKQEWIRSILLPQDCYNQSQTDITSTHQHHSPNRPILVLIEDLILPGTANGILSGSLYTRTVQRLSDWYQLPFVSLNSLVQPLLLLLQQEQTSLQNEQDMMIPMLVDAISFAFTDFTMDFCETFSMSETNTMMMTMTNSPLLKPGVERLVNYIVPPILDVSLGLRDVTRKWKEEEVMQANC